jgi:hypothetical protein
MIHLGSVLEKKFTDEKSIPVWAPSVAAILEALNPFGPGWRQLALQGDDPEVDVLDDGIQATALFPDVHFVPGLAKIDGYSELVRMLTETFDVVPGSAHNPTAANIYPFPYDWRRDNRAAARQLACLVKLAASRTRQSRDQING